MKIIYQYHDQEVFVFILSSYNEEDNITADRIFCNLYNSGRIADKHLKVLPFIFVKISVTFGQGDSCEECINIENTPGIENDPELIGSYK